jgi:hypothetical protein
MMTLPIRRIGRLAAAIVAGWLADASIAAAQDPTLPTWPPPTINPWLPGQPAVTPPVVGQLPTGTPVINPWVRPAVVTPQSLFAQQYALLNAAPIWNPSLAPYWAAAGLNAPWGLNNSAPVLQPGAFGPGVQPVPAGAVPTVSTFVARPGLTVGGFTQVEPGWFSRLGPDLAVNRITGTVLRPYSGVAFTAEGPFVRVPGSGTFTPWGMYIPGTGIFVNPFTGAAYNPQTGLILR